MSGDRAPLATDTPETGPFPHDAAASQGAAALPDAPLQGDLTQGPILKTLLVFSVPTLISNVLQTLNGSINAIWVGRLIGESALAATANANIIMFMLFAAVFGLGMATTVRVGQVFGTRDLTGTRRVFGSGLGLCLVLAAIVGIAGWLYSAPILMTIGTPEESMVQAVSYMKVIFITTPLATISMMVGMGMRGVGDSKTPLYAMILTVALDIMLNPLLILGAGPIPGLGIAGSAIAMAIANTSGSAWMIWIAYRRDLPLRLRGAELRFLVPYSDEIRFIIAKGLPMGAQMVVVAAAGLVMMGLVNKIGLNAAAAYGASLQLWNYLQMPAFAISSAVSAMVAQSVGAGDHGRVSRVNLAGIGTSVLLSVVIAALIVGFAKPILTLFLGPGSSALPIAVHIQLVCTASFVITAVTSIMTGTLRAYGAVMAPLVIMIMAFYPGRLGFYAIAHHWIGDEAVWWAYPVGSVVSVALTWAYYRFGGWRKAQVKEK